MSTRGITPRLADRLCSLAESQLQTQAARSASVDAGGLGVVSACAAIAAHALLGISAGLAVRALLVGGAKGVGPLLTEILNDRDTHNHKELEQSLLEDLVDETLVNNQGLARKDPCWPISGRVRSPERSTLQPLASDQATRGTLATAPESSADRRNLH